MDMSKTRKSSFWESQRLVKERVHEKRASSKKISLDSLKTFSLQLSSMLDAGLPLIGALEALQEQTEDPVFRVIIRNVRTEVSAGSSFSDALKRYPNAFPKLLLSMVEAGEASGSLSQLIGKAATYFEGTSALIKKVRSVLAYPIAVIALAIVLVNIMLIFIIPVFAELFADFNVLLPLPTRIVIGTSAFLKSNIIYILLLGIGLWFFGRNYFRTARGRITKDRLLHKIPILGVLKQKVAISRFARTYAVLFNSGVPILRCITICSSASDNTFIEDACAAMSRQVTQGGQISLVLKENHYFPPVVSHMARAGEQTGKIEAMMDKVADYYDMEVNNTIAVFSSLLEPLLIVILGIFVGGIVIAMFMPIFELAGVIGGSSSGSGGF